MTSSLQETIASLIEISRLERDQTDICNRTEKDPDLVQALLTVDELVSLLNSAELTALTVRLLHKHLGCQVHAIFLAGYMEDGGEPLSGNFWLMLYLISLEIKSKRTQSS